MASDWETYDRPATGNDLRAVESAVREACISRRERIATAVLAGIATRLGMNLYKTTDPIRVAVWAADALIAELDK